MKSVLSAICLTLLICLALGNQFQGYDQIATTATQGDPNACFLTLDDLKNTTAITVQQIGSLGATMGSNLTDCQYHNMIFNSFFHDDQLNDDIPFNAPINNSLVNATFDAPPLQRNNGTGCVFLPQTQMADDSYVCHFLFSNVHIYTAIYGTDNFTFDPNTAGMFLPNFANIHAPSMEYNMVSQNTSFPTILGSLKDACNDTSNNVSNLSSTVMLSSDVNLTTVLPGMWVAYTLVKQRGAFNPGNYTSRASNQSTGLFDQGNSMNCWSMNMKYADIITDLNYCSMGCQISFILTDSQKDFYLLFTSGITTVPNNSSGGNGTGNGTSGGNQGGNQGGNGQGNNTSGNQGGGGNVGTSGSSGNNTVTVNTSTGNVVVSFGTSLNFSLLLLLLSFVYLAHL